MGWLVDVIDQILTRYCVPVAVLLFVLGILSDENNPQRIELAIVVVIVVFGALWANTHRPFQRKPGPSNGNPEGRN